MFIVGLYSEKLFNALMNTLEDKQSEDSIVKDNLHSEIFLWLLHLSNLIRSKFIPFLPKLMQIINEYNKCSNMYSQQGEHVGIKIDIK